MQTPKALSNEHRLLILCHLIAEEEMSVGELVSKIGLSQSALSQHLAKLRHEELVTFRREAQTLFYRVRDERAQACWSSCNVCSARSGTTGKESDQPDDVIVDRYPEKRCWRPRQ